MSISVSAPSAAASIEQVHARELAEVSGRVIAVTVEPHDSSPRLVARLADDTASIDLVFLGRRALPGVFAGTKLRASGRVCATRAGDLAIYNPRYEIATPR